MSNLYAIINTDKGKTGHRTACALRRVSASAQSWDGSVTVRIDKNGKAGAAIVSIEAAEGSQHGGRVLWTGPLAELLAAGALAIVPRGE